MINMDEKFDTIFFISKLSSETTGDIGEDSEKPPKNKKSQRRV
jgi:hypothetical protein